MADDDPHEDRTDHSTPAGGTYSIARYFDAAGAPCPRSRASRMTITEHAPDGSVLASTTGSLAPERID